jgi:hypothetical protein
LDSLSGNGGAPHGASSPQPPANPTSRSHPAPPPSPAQRTGRTHPPPAHRQRTGRTHPSPPTLPADPTGNWGSGRLSLPGTPYPWLAPKFARFAVVPRYPTRDKTAQPGIRAPQAAHSSRITTPYHGKEIDKFCPLPQLANRKSVTRPRNPQQDRAARKRPGTSRYWHGAIAPKRLHWLLRLLWRTVGAGQPNRSARQVSQPGRLLDTPSQPGKLLDTPSQPDPARQTQPAKPRQTDRQTQPSPASQAQPDRLAGRRPCRPSQTGWPDTSSRTGLAAHSQPGGSAGDRWIGLVDAGVGVQARDPEVDADQVEHQAAEAEQLNRSGSPSAPASGGAGVKERRVDQPGDE